MQKAYSQLSDISSYTWLRVVLLIRADWEGLCFSEEKGSPEHQTSGRKTWLPLKELHAQKSLRKNTRGKQTKTTRIFLPFRKDCQGLEGLDKEMDHQPTDLSNWFWCLNCCFLGAREHCTMNRINKLSQHVCSPNKTSFTMQHKQVLNILPRCSWIVLCIAKSFLQQKLFIAWWV